MSKNNNSINMEAYDDNNNFYDALPQQVAEVTASNMKLFYSLIEGDDNQRSRELEYSHLPNKPNKLSHIVAAASNSCDTCDKDVGTSTFIENFIFELDEDLKNDPSLLMEMKRVDRCSFCDKKCYYYDLFIYKDVQKKRSYKKMCIDCVLEKVELKDKRNLLDVEYKADKKMMIKPMMCSKCHAARSAFRFNKRKEGTRTYCFFCKKKRFFTLRKKNPDRPKKYISPIMKIFGDPNEH